ncbi:serine hydrolase domain-containing protein [Niveispirillum sp. BGYR6]|uniref:serine hydrolase domain-containing protein n=1 Tax=Niveispirillum sp. BGYR6 TaxID=2971249 RepID=UPI0022B95414|nr:serine hydrolase domain-containing protein [Niveispirillum sp. BGYR6]MDG5495308.1 serine hydrolase [Niveispirillum sp. BGYR6]
MRRTFVGLLSLTLAFAATAAPAADPAMTARLDQAINQAIASKRIVGTVVLVANEGEIIYHRAAGFADREAARSMREDAIFRLASISKPIVSAAFMRLVEDQTVDLDDPVTKWLPDFRPRMANGDEPSITLRQLLTHMSGLSYRFLEPAGSPYHRLNVSDGMDQPGLGLDENLHRLGQAPLAFHPGDGWRYSLGIDVLGAVIEKATGERLPDLVRARVTGPLEMRDTGFVVTDPSRLATPYADGAPEPIRMTDGIFVALWNAGANFAPSRALNLASYASGGAGMVGTAGDVLRFLETIRTGGGSILLPATVAAMMRDQVGPKAQTQGPGWGFGYGWAVLNDPASAGTPQSAGTIQWGGAYGHSWFVDPARKLTVIALTNTAFEGMSGAFPIEIRDAVYGGKGE